MSNPLRVLIVEDSEDDVLLLLRELRRGHYTPSYSVVYSADTMREALATKEWDLIISDYSLPSFTGLDALMLTKSMGLELPFIIVSGNIGEETAVKVMKAGAHDYLFKGNLRRLVPAIERELHEAQVRATQRRTENELHRVEAEYQRLIEHIPAVTYIATIGEGRTIKYVSPQIADVLGFPQSAFLGDAELWQNRIHPDDRERATETLRLSVISHTPIVCEYRMVHQDGSIVWVRDEAVVAHEYANGLAHLDGLIMVVTEQKQAEEAIRSYQKQLRSLASELLLAEERERRRIAVGIHDTVTQMLALTKIRLGGIGKSVQSTEVARQIQAVRDCISQSIEYTRTLTFELSPPPLYDLGFVPAVEWFAEKTQDEHGIRVVVSADDADLTLSDDMRVLLYQSVRELVVNAVKHAEATMIEITVQSYDDKAFITVADNGNGCDTSQLESERPGYQGFGLFSIRERLHYLGGQISIASNPGIGTRIRLTVPLHDDADAVATNPAAENSLC